MLYALKNNETFLFYFIIHTRYYKKISVGDLDRISMKLNPRNLSYSYSNNTLIISVCKYFHNKTGLSAKFISKTKLLPLPGYCVSIRAFNILILHKNNWNKKYEKFFVRKSFLLFNVLTLSSSSWCNKEVNVKLFLDPKQKYIFQSLFSFKIYSSPKTGKRWTFFYNKKNFQKCTLLYPKVYVFLYSVLKL